MSSKSCDEIKALLARFYDGMTTEAEDARLRELLGDENLPDDLKQRGLFSQLFAESGRWCFPMVVRRVGVVRLIPAGMR
ncbi:MAG: hypothetical protein K2F62_07435, partial [Muribaculaceae bacterium]|nr:hypothetical protein [Muribaculaceae bacterium]